MFLFYMSFMFSGILLDLVLIIFIGPLRMYICKILSITPGGFISEQMFILLFFCPFTLSYKLSLRKLFNTLSLPFVYLFFCS